MKLPILDVDTPEVKKLIFALQTVLSNLSSDNMKAEQLIGTTNSSADTSSEFKHSLGKAPALWFALEGDVYIPRYGMKENFVDVRSRTSSEDFRILLIY